MKAPNNKAGMLTEKIMLQVNKNLPNISTHEYNKTWEAVLSVLTMELSESGAENEIMHTRIDMAVMSLTENKISAEARLKAFADLVWDARWPDSHQHDYLFGIAAEIRSGNFESIDKHALGAGADQCHPTREGDSAGLAPLKPSCSGSETFPEILGRRITRAEIIEGLWTMYGAMVKHERFYFPDFKRFPDTETILHYIEEKGLPPKL